MIREFGADTTVFDWSQSDTRSSLLCGISILLCLVVGILTGHERQGMNAAYGAMSVAFGRFQKDQYSGHMSRVVASFAMALSIMVGGLVAPSLLASALAVGVWGLVSGMLISLGTETSWIGVQGAVALFLAISYSASGGKEWLRVLLVLAGGLLQSAVLYLFCEFGWLSGCEPFADRVRFTFEEFRRELGFHSPHFRFALRTAALLALAASVSRYLGIQNSYWVPMTALLVVKPDFIASFARGLARVGGTLIGAGLVTLLVAHVRMDEWSLAIVTAACAVLCYNLLRVNYALYTVFITSYVVFMLAFGGMPTHAVVVARILNTLMGGAIGLIGRTIAAKWEFRAHAVPA